MYTYLSKVFRGLSLSWTLILGGESSEAGVTLSENESSLFPLKRAILFLNVDNEVSLLCIAMNSSRRS